MKSWPPLRVYSGAVAPQTKKATKKKKSPTKKKFPTTKKVTIEEEKLVPFKGVSRRSSAKTTKKKDPYKGVSRRSSAETTK